MLWLYPKPPADPRIPQWWVFSLETNRRLKSISMLWRLGPISLHWQRNHVEITNHSNYARPTRFYVIRLNNPVRSGMGTGVAKIFRLICVDCGLEFPCPANLDTPVLCDCALVRKSSIMLWWNRNLKPQDGELLYKRSYEITL